jgi:long-chain acyl-CoA synthetase
VIFAPNHASNLDPLALAAAFNWRELHRTYWAGWTGILFAGGIMRMISRAAQILPVDPDRNPGAALALGATVLRNGFRLVWFPEGRRSPTGEITTFLPGIGHLVRETNATVVPVRINGTFEAWPRSRRMPRFSQISVAFGQPIAAEVLIGLGPAPDLNERIADALREAVAALPET